MPAPAISGSALASRYALRLAFRELYMQAIMQQVALSRIDMSWGVEAVVNGADPDEVKRHLQRPRHVEVNPLTGEFSVSPGPAATQAGWAADERGSFPGETHG